MKQLSIKYFGMLAEVTNCEEEIFYFSGTTISELVDSLCSKHSGLKDKIFQVAQNKELVSLDDELSHHEIVFLPPFAGG